MNGKNNELFDEKLQAIFDERELKTETVVIMLDNARKSSINVERVKRKTVLERVNLDEVANKVTLLALACAVSLTVTAGAWVAVEKGVQAFNNISDYVLSSFNNDLSMSKLSVEIGALTDSQLKENGYARTILNQNVVHAEGNNFYYRHESIARDLLRIDERLFDYAFCTVCEDMGAFINNQVGPGGMSNIESVIFYLKQFSSDKDTSSKLYVSETLEGVSTLDDYLKKFGYVDKNEKPSLNEFKKACNNNAEVISAILHGNELSEGAKLS